MQRNITRGLSEQFPGSGGDCAAIVAAALKRDGEFNVPATTGGEGRHFEVIRAGAGKGHIAVIRRVRTNRIVHDDIVFRSDSILVFIDPQTASVVHTNRKTVGAGSAHENLSIAHQSPGAGYTTGNGVVD